MTNPYFDDGDYAELTRNTLGRAEAVNAIFGAIVAGFDLLPDPSKIHGDRAAYAADTGTADHYLVALDASIVAYAAGMRVTMKVLNTNTGASDINVNSIGTKAIKRADGAALAAGDMTAGSIAILVDDGTAFRLVSPNMSDVTTAVASAAAAAASASAASSSAGSAASSASAASTSATNAANSASAADASADAAATSETNAASSASAAATSETNAAASASSASTSASTAGTHATNASNSASTASTQATNASNSASAASTSATNAGNSATAAATSATNAENSATAAAASAVAAAASAAAAAASVVPRGFIDGLILSTAGSSATFGISAGYAVDGTGSQSMVLPSAYTKTTGAWAVGSTFGSLDTGTIANNTWYHVWLIKRTDTQVVDVLTSLSATAPTMPANYTLKRRIGAMKTNGSGQWILFSQDGDEFLWAAGVFDATTVTPANTNAASVTLTTPPGVKTRAIISAWLLYNTVASIGYLSSLDTTDGAASSQVGLRTGTAATISFGRFEIRTDTSAAIRVRFSSTGSDYSIQTMGWIDPRGRNG